MNNTVLNSNHARNAAYRVHLKNRNAQNLIHCKQLRNKSIRLTRLAKRQFLCLVQSLAPDISGKMLIIVLVLVN